MRKFSRAGAVLVAAALTVGWLTAPVLAGKEKTARAESEAPVDWKLETAESERLSEHRELERAEIAAQSALKQVKRQRPVNVDRLIFCELQLADVIYGQDRLEESMPLYKKAMHLAERHYGKTSSKLVPVLITIGGVYELEGTYRRAEQYYQRALTIAETNDGAMCLASAQPRQRLARVKAEQGLPGTARELDLASLSILLKQDKLADIELLREVLADYSNIVLLSSDQGKSLASSFQGELLRDKIGSLKQKQGAPSSSSFESLKELVPAGNSSTGNDGTFRIDPGAQIHMDRKPNDLVALEQINQQRVSFYERLIATDIDALGAEHPSVARDLSGLASIYISSKNYEKAKPLLNRALDIYIKVYKDDAAPVRQTKLLLELMAESSASAGVPLDSSFLETLPKIPVAAQTLETALRLNDLAFMLYCQGDIDSSLRVYGWALSGTALTTGTDSVLTAATMVDMSKLLRLRGRSSDAEKLENNARAIARQEILDKRSSLLP